MTALSAVLLSAAGTMTGPPAPHYAFVNGRWWNGSAYEERTFYTADGMLTSQRPAFVDQTVDLHGGFVIPPLAEGHNHWLEPSIAANLDNLNSISVRVKQGRRISVPASAISRPSPDCTQGAP